MITAIIVDDEEQSRYGLERFFDFSRYGIQITAYASNGQEALERIRTGRHQLVITDVRMPVMDGIALCEKLREEFDDAIQVMFISAYNDLSYLHSAIRVGAVEYLTKPIDFEEFDQVMQRVSGKIKKNNKREEQLQPEDHQVARKQYFASLLIRNTWEAPQESLRLPADAVFAPVMIHPLAPVSERSVSALKDICLQQLRDVPDACVIMLNYGDLCVVYPSDQTDLLITFASRVQQQLISVLNTKTMIGIGKPGTLQELGESYKVISRHIDQQLSLEENDVFLWTDAQCETNALSLHSQTISALLSAFRELDEQALHTALEAVYSDIVSHPHTPLENCRVYLLQLLTHVINYLTEQGVTSLDSAADIMSLYRRMKALYSFAELKAFSQECMVSYFQLISAKQAEQASQTVRHIKKYIANHYAQTITVKDIANAVYLSTAYTCTLFKKETGETINDYLTTYRMKRAAEMLINPRYKLYQISQAVGYSDAAYFTRQFRVFSGKTPSEYRKQRMKDDQESVQKSEHP